jgi:hypothetical protein
MLCTAHRVQWLAGMLALAGIGEAGACNQGAATEFVELRLTQPLVATAGDDTATRVAVREDGCVLLHYPAYDSRHGEYAYRLTGEELGRLRADLADSRVASFDPAAVAQELQRREAIKRASPDGLRRHVSDEAVIELRIVKPAGPDGARHEFTWSGVRGQLLDHPDLAAVAGLAAARDRLLNLGSDRRMQKVQP